MLTNMNKQKTLRVK
jgi:hypothetical protein